MPLGAVVVDVACGHHGNLEPVGQAAQAPVPVAIPLLLVVLELHEELPVSESALKTSGQELCGCHAVLEGDQKGALPAPGEGDETLCAGEEGGERKGGAAAITLQMCLTQEPAEVGIPGRGLGQEGHVAAADQRVTVRVGGIEPVQALGDSRNVQGHGDLCTRDGLESFGAGRLGELHGAIEAVVVGEGQGRIPHLQSSGNQLLGMGGSIQEGEAGVTVKLDVGRCGHGLRVFIWERNRI